MILVKHLLISYLAVSFFLIGLPGYVYIGEAHALPVPTEHFFSAEKQAQSLIHNRATIAEFVARAEVRNILVGYGVSEQEALNRVGSMSDTEVIYMAGMIEQLPAGGNGLGTVVVAVVVVFLVLLFTDILGLTKVYPFTR